MKITRVMITAPTMMIIDHSGDEDHVGVDAPVAHCGPV